MDAIHELRKITVELLKYKIYIHHGVPDKELIAALLSYLSSLVWLSSRRYFFKGIVSAGRGKEAKEDILFSSPTPPLLKFLNKYFNNLTDPPLPLLNSLS